MWRIRYGGTKRLGKALEQIDNQSIVIRGAHIFSCGFCFFSFFSFLHRR